MSQDVYLKTVNAKENSIAGGNPSIVEFSSPLKPGDTISIITPITQTWNSGGGPNTTNADGVVVLMGPPLKVNWGSFNPGRPNLNAVPKTPNAVNYDYGIGCLVCSFDQGKTFVAIGTHYTATILQEDISSLWLYYWDVNNADNSGSITFTITINLI